MDTSLTIPQDPVYPHSMDWQFLRQEGIKHIERLSSAIWTDFNLHDPGITILEILCYAITDLGYRANLDPADLFSAPGENTFFTAAKILPCDPVTAIDLRKVLIDITGVKNAWVGQMEDAEMRFFLSQKLSDKLLTELDPYRSALGITDTQGYYKMSDIPAELLEKLFKCQSDKDRAANQEAFYQVVMSFINVYENTQKILLLYMADRYFAETRYFFEYQLPVDSLDNSLTTEMKVSEGKTPYDLAGYVQVSDYFLIVNELRHLRELYRSGNFEYDWGSLLREGDPDSTLLKLIGANANARVQDFLYKEPLICLLLAGSLNASAMPEAEEKSSLPYNLFIPQGVYSVTLRLEDGQEGDEDTIIDEALRRLHLHRNLGEDFSPKVHIVETIPIGIDLALEIDPAEDALAVMAAVYYSIQEYLSPTIRFYSLEERMNHYAAFLIDADVINGLQDAQLPDAVTAALAPIQGQYYIGDAAFQKAVASVLGSEDLADYYNDIFTQAKKDYDADLVYQGPLLDNGFIDDDQLAAATPRQTLFRSDLYQLIAAVEGVVKVARLEMFQCKDPDHSSGNWCLSFPCRCLPELDPDCSIFAVRSGRVETAVDMEQLLTYLEAHPQSSTKINRHGMLDLPVPTGVVRNDLTEFTSVQMDFPRTYKIGNTGISSRETDLRQAQARQLKAYLLFYDQLFANYLSYLSSVKTMFSVEQGDVVSYQPLYDVPGIKELLLDYAPGTDWDAFIANEDNPYITAVRQLAQGNDADKALFRNKVLDHLLARFGEKFTDYILQLYRIDRPVSGSTWDEHEGLQDDIDDKKYFLQNVPTLGAARATGFNYHFDKVQPPAFWNTDNTEGVKKRVCAILGIRDNTRHTITCEPAFIIDVGPARTTADSSPGRVRYEFYLKASEQSTSKLLVSTAKFSTVDAAEKASNDFLNMAVEKDNYGIIQGSSSQAFIIGFWPNIAPANRTTANALLLEPNESTDDPAPRLKQIQDLAAGNCEDDSFHLLEHILLRPRNDSFTQLLNPMICCVEDPSMLDPYSFWITVVLPGWTSRFKDEGRRQVFMQTLQKELPAQLEVRSCLLSRDAMFRFEQAYYDWLKALFSENQEMLPATTDALVTVINSWDPSTIDYFSKSLIK